MISNVNKHQLGFTIIELMISVSILSLLLFVGSFSYSLMADKWELELSKFSEFSTQAKKIESLQKLLEGIQPYVVVDKSRRPSFFFVGKEKTLLAISRTGIHGDIYPVVFRLSTLKNTKGRFDLVYQSISIRDILLLTTEQEVDFKTRVVLLSDLDEVFFEYFGWRNLEEKSNLSNVGSQPSWYTRYSGIDQQLIPIELLISFTKGNKVAKFPISLNNSPEKLLSSYFEGATGGGDGNFK